MSTEYEKLREKVARAILKTRYYDVEPEMYESLEVFHQDVWPDHGDEALEQAEAAMSTIYEALRGHGKKVPSLFTDALWSSPLNGGRDE